jgi:hypothetical protein
MTSSSIEVFDRLHDRRLDGRLPDVARQENSEDECQRPMRFLPSGKKLGR